jgi:hypothetical protein
MPLTTKTRPIFGLTCLAFLALFSTIGCEREAQVSYSDVSGTVSLGGKALSGVVVTFYPDSEGPKALPFSRGTTDSAGKYILVCQTGERGGVVGKNRVVVNWPMQSRADGDGKGQSPSQPRPMIPLRFTVADNTPISIEVKPGGPQVIDLPLVAD